MPKKKFKQPKAAAAADAAAETAAAESPAEDASAEAVKPSKSKKAVTPKAKAKPKAKPKSKKKAAAVSDREPKGGRKGPSLVVVESPAKERTISRFLKNEFVVRSSYGHVRD